MHSDLQGKWAFVTGSTDGLGRAVAVALATAGATVVVHGRDRARGAQVVAEIERGGGTAIFEPADLASLAEVRRLADAVLRHTDRLDLFIDNAAVGPATGGPDRRLSADGHELRFAVNYLAAGLLTRLLLPALRRAAPARIVRVASMGQEPIDFDDPMLERGYSGLRAYSRSKLAQIMDGFDLAETLAGSGVTANCLHPATLMPTTMVLESGVPAWSSIADGAAAVLRLAVGREVEGTNGGYFDGQETAEAGPQAYDPAARRRLRAIGEALTADFSRAPATARTPP